jgi:hypothetical protein
MFRVRFIMLKFKNVWIKKKWKYDPFARISKTLFISNAGRKCKMSNKLLYSGLSKKWKTYVWIRAPVHSRADKCHELVASLVHHKTAHCNKKVQHYALSESLVYRVSVSSQLLTKRSAFSKELQGFQWFFSGTLNIWVTQAKKIKFFCRRSTVCTLPKVFKLKTVSKMWHFLKN